MSRTKLKLMSTLNIHKNHRMSLTFNRLMSCVAVVDSSTNILAISFIVESWNTTRNCIEESPNVIAFVFRKVLFKPLAMPVVDSCNQQRQRLIVLVTTQAEGSLGQAKTMIPAMRLRWIALV